jgi:hypothetical protein
MNIHESVYFLFHTRACNHGVNYFLTLRDVHNCRENTCYGERGIYGCRIIRFDRQPQL